MPKLRFRQVHLDFHTSPAIPDIGSKFDKKKYQKTLQEAHVDSITTFATCHHGWCYFDTKIGKKHPHLGFDLLKEQYEACKEIDINVPIYITAGVNNMIAEAHPEWRMVSADGTYAGWTSSPIKPGFKGLCFNSPYLDHLCDLIEEVATLYPDCDGIFTDIIDQNPCVCQYCLKDMEKEGFDPESEDHRIAFSKKVLRKYYKASTKAAKKNNPNMTIFHNSGHVQRGETDILQYFDHLELESLPTGGWGYDHFPMSAKYCENLPHDFLGMTGKFHTSWGEFGGIKHPNALRYECSAMLAYGSKCSVGDQLHPNGHLDETTYRVIGEAFKDVAQKEAWCDDVTSIADIAILSSVSVDPSHPRIASADIGASRILLEEQMLFTILDGDMDFSPYKLLILPDDVMMSKELKEKIQKFLNKGGKLLLSGQSGVTENFKSFHFDTGAEIDGLSPYAPDYLMPKEEFRSEFVSSPVVAYTPSYRIKVKDGESLGEIHDPYFNRTYEHFCSHQHTPYKAEPSGYDCGVIKGNIAYIAHPIFTLYRSLGAVVYKDYAISVIKKLLGDDLSINTNMPSMARLSLNKQKDQNRFVLHLLYANTINRGGRISLHGGNMVGSAKGTEVIEDLMPLYNTEVELKVDQKISKITLEPQGQELQFDQNENGIKIKVDSFTCHQMVALSYA
jgi:hypothetical protein